MPAYPDGPTAEIASGLRGLPSGSASSVVAQRLLELFTSGDIAAGTRLPPERQLAASLEIGRSAVREALAALEVLGIVDVRPGSGTYLRGTASELLPRSLAWGMLIGERNTQELIELRTGLETFAARLAAERMPDDEVERLGEALASMEAALEHVLDGTGDPAAFVEADLQFHSVLSQATGNGVLLDQLRTIRSLLRVWVDRAVRDEGHMRAALAEHAAVYAAIRAHDASAAAEAMAEHMRTAGRRLSGATASA